jgi:hypothetical protein
MEKQKAHLGTYKAVDLPAFFNNIAETSQQISKDLEAGLARLSEAVPLATEAFQNRVKELNQLFGGSKTE